MFSGTPYKIFVTGGDGFVGRHLTRRLMEICRPDDQLLVGVMKADDGAPNHARTTTCDITSYDQVSFVVQSFQPTHIVHLAAISNVRVAESDAQKAWYVNVHGTLNVASAIRQHFPNCRLVHCSSGLIYGDKFRAGGAVGEDALLDPVDVYGATKAAGDLLVGQMAKQGLRAVRLRPFNHIGVGQSEQFVVPAFASQIARAEREGGASAIRVGNLDSQRDLTDVEDVVGAYIATIRQFDNLPNGVAINIASGKALSTGDILEILLGLSSKRIEVEVDENRVRKSDIPVVLGDPTLAKRLLRWQPRHNIQESLGNILNYYRRIADETAEPGAR